MGKKGIGEKNFSKKSKKLLKVRRNNKSQKKRNLMTISKRKSFNTIQIEEELYPPIIILNKEIRM